MGKTCALVVRLNKWNCEVFGHLSQKKNRLLARLEGIQKVLCNGPNVFLSNLEDKLIADFNELLAQETIFWHKKSRLKWLQEGDRNTKFFHLAIIIRRRRNIIEGLKIDHGVWVEDTEGIKATAVAYFQKLFSHGQYSRQVRGLPSLFPVICPDDCASLIRNVTPLEVKASLFNICSFKAPGVDAFPSGS